MCRVSQVVQQDFNSRIRKGFSDQTHNALVVFKEFLCVVRDRFPVVFLEQLRVNLLLSRLKLCAHIILLANENQLSRGGMIFVLEEIMHAQPEVFQTELAEILASDCEWIEVVLFQISTEFLAAFLVFAPQKPCYQKGQRHDDRGDDVDTEFALQSFYHRRNVFFVAVARGMRPLSVATGALKNGSQIRGYNLL